MSKHDKLCKSCIEQATDAVLQRRARGITMRRIFVALSAVNAGIFMYVPNLGSFLTTILFLVIAYTYARRV